MKSILAVFRKTFLLGVVIGAFCALKCRCNATEYYNTKDEQVELLKLLEPYLEQESTNLDALRESFTIHHPGDTEASENAAGNVYGRFKNIQYLIDLRDARSCEMYANVLFGIVCLAYECRTENEPTRAGNLTCVVVMLAGDLLKGGEYVPKEVSDRMGIKQKQFLEGIIARLNPAPQKRNQCSIQ